MKILLLLLLPLISVEAVAEIYKWLDRDGNIVYSQSPPPIGATALKTPQITSAADNSGVTGSRAEEIISSEKEARERRLERQQQKKDTRANKARKKQLQQSCQKLRENLKTMKSEGLVYLGEPGTSNRLLSERELLQRTREAEETINKHCMEIH